MNVEQPSAEQHLLSPKSGVQPEPGGVVLGCGNGTDKEPQAPRHSTTRKVVISGFVTPQPEDVVFGRGRPLQRHPGNQRFRKLVELHSLEYESASKFERTVVAARVVQTMKQLAGVRFLKAVDGDRWVEVDESTVHKKVCQCFRTHRRKTASNT